MKFGIKAEIFRFKLIDEILYSKVFIDKTLFVFDEFLLFCKMSKVLFLIKY